MIQFLIAQLLFMILGVIFALMGITVLAGISAIISICAGLAFIIDDKGIA